MQEPQFTISQPISLYRKFRASQLFTGHEMLNNDHVLITDSSGLVIDTVKISDAGDEIENLEGILTPGFINCHCHTELSHLKGVIPKLTGLVDFLYTVITKRDFPVDEILMAITLAEEQMITNGIVAVGDICNTTKSIAQKRRSRIYYHNFIEVTGFIPEMATERFNAALKILSAFATLPGKNSLVPHAPYSVSPDLFSLINLLPANNLISIHNQETEDENELYQSGQGNILKLYEQLGIDISFFRPSKKSSLQTWLPYFNRDQAIIMVHDVATSPADIALMKKAGSESGIHPFLCLCPNANLYISGKLPDVIGLGKHYDDIVLGTDSLASNDELNIVEEIKTLQHHFPSLSLPRILKWATSNGAKALNMADRLGSFEKGKMPGVVLIQQNENGTLKNAARVI